MKSQKIKIFSRPQEMFSWFTVSVNTKNCICNLVYQHHDGKTLFVKNLYQ